MVLGTETGVRHERPLHNHCCVPSPQNRLCVVNQSHQAMGAAARRKKKKSLLQAVQPSHKYQYFQPRSITAVEKHGRKFFPDSKSWLNLSCTTTHGARPRRQAPMSRASLLRAGQGVWRGGGATPLRPAPDGQGNLEGGAGSGSKCRLRQALGPSHQFRPRGMTCLNSGGGSQAEVTGVGARREQPAGPAHARRALSVLDFGSRATSPIPGFCSGRARGIVQAAGFGAELVGKLLGSVHRRGLSFSELRGLKGTGESSGLLQPWSLRLSADSSGPAGVHPDRPPPGPRVYSGCRCSGLRVERHGLSLEKCPHTGQQRTTLIPASGGCCGVPGLSKKDEELDDFLAIGPEKPQDGETGRGKDWGGDGESEGQALSAHVSFPPLPAGENMCYFPGPKCMLPEYRIGSSKLEGECVTRKDTCAQIFNSVDLYKCGCSSSLPS